MQLGVAPAQLVVHGLVKRDRGQITGKIGALVGFLHIDFAADRCANVGKRDARLGTCALGALHVLDYAI